MLVELVDIGKTLLCSKAGEYNNSLPKHIYFGSPQSDFDVWW